MCCCDDVQDTTKATANDAISVIGDVQRASDQIPTTVYHVTIPSECAHETHFDFSKSY